MKNISQTASFIEIQTAARSIGMDVTTGATLFELWKDDRYKGGYPTLEMLAQEVSLHLSMAADAAAERASQFEQVRTALENQGATEAAVLQHGKVIGLCTTAAGRGKSIQLANAVTDDGRPLNTHNLEISRSKQNLKAAQLKSQFTARIYDGEIFYVCQHDPY
jgi:hypothetical protein